jgi:glycosyltransferase involved in cell wall biosynthesis
LKLKLFIIGSAGIPARYGGFETYAENLSLRLSIDFDVFITCSTKIYLPEERQKRWNNINRIFIPIRPNGAQSVIFDFISLFIALSKADFIILLGSGSGLILPFFRVFKKMPLAVHIDGLEWKRGKWNWPTKIFLKLNYQLCLSYSKYIIVDNKALIKNIPEKYSYKIETMVYGCEHINDTEINVSLPEKPFALVIARAEPENNLGMIIDAFKSITDLNLIIISNYRYTKYGRWLFENTKANRSVKMIGPIYDDRDLLQQYRMRCSVYIHGHSAGGSNPSLIEAMATGKPILAFNNEFNRITTNNRAFYFDNSVTLFSLLNSLNKDDFLISAQDLKKFARTEYNWNSIAQKVESLIKQECTKIAFSEIKNAGMP